MTQKEIADRIRQLHDDTVQRFEDYKTMGGCEDSYLTGKIIGLAEALEVITNDPPVYAELSWSPEDVQELRPSWDIVRCEDWLIANEKYIRDKLCDLGFGVIENLLPPPDPQPTEDH